MSLGEVVVLVDTLRLCFVTMEGVDIATWKLRRESCILNDLGLF